MRFPSRDEIQAVRARYPAGTRIRLISMEDPYAPIKPDTCGTVMSVDDLGDLIMKWDNSRTLAIVPEEDEFQVI